jgi:hypothetical protein
MESTPVGQRKDCDVMMQLKNLSTHSRSTAEIDVEQIAFCVGSIWSMAAAGDSASRSCGERSVKTAVPPRPLYNFLQSFAVA